jgi:HlyD family secretion protein
MVSPWPRRLLYTVLVLGIGGGLAYAFREQPRAVDMAEVSRGDMRVTLDGEGRTRVRDVYVVSAPVGGRKLRISQKVGAPVLAGKTVLAAIEPNDPSFLDVRSEAEAAARIKAAEAASALANADLKRFQAELDFAHADHKRATELVKRGTISTRDLERADLAVRTREAAVSTAEAGRRVKRYQLETARAALIDPSETGGARSGGCCVQVRSPVDGQVLRVLVESESVVQAGAPLVEIGDPGRLEIIVDLLSSDAVQVRVGDEVLIDEWGGDTVLPGTVRHIEPAGFTKISALGIEEQRVNVLIDLTGPSEAYARLGHGFRVETNIVIWRAKDILLLPMSALFRSDDDWAVFSVAAGKAALRRVRIGHTNGTHAELLDGLGSGDKIIEHPSDIIVDGSLVVARKP